MLQGDDDSTPGCEATTRNIRALYEEHYALFLLRLKLYLQKKIEADSCCNESCMGLM